MRGAAITLARQVMESGTRYDAILATDMLDLPLFQSLIRKRYSNVPIGLYFHENQILYPWSPRDSDIRKGRDASYGFINYASALSADKVFFNSDFHRNAFLDALPDFLGRFPDSKNLDTQSEIADKSETLWLGLDLQGLDIEGPKPKPKDYPLIVWNHRWEYDKNPIGFFRILYQLRERGCAFNLALLGERFDEEPPYFLKAKRILGERIRQYGRLDKFQDYAQWLWEADIALVTSKQDFFGGSVVETLYCGCHPILPRRLAYTDHIDPAEHPECYYESEGDAVDCLQELISGQRWRSPAQFGKLAARYDWSARIADYDRAIGRLMEIS